MKRLFGALIAPAVLAAGISTASAQEQTTIRWLEWWEGEYGADVLNDLTSRFEEQTGIKVERTSVPWGNMFDTLVANARAEVADYDVLGMEGCCFLTAIDRLGGLEPLDDYLAKDAEFAESLTSLTPMTWNGQTLMLNWYIMPYSYVYNIDIFEKAGVEPPKSWDEVIPAAKAIAESGAAEYGLGAFFNESDPIYVPYYLFGSKLAQLGGSFFDENGKAAFNSPEGVAALEWWKSVNESGVLAPGVYGMNWPQLREQFATGKIAAVWDGPFAGSIARQIDPNIRVAYAPAWCDETCGYQWAGSGLAIASNSEKKDAAWQFMKFLLSEEITLEMTKRNAVPYATKAAVASLENSDDPILKEIPAMLNGDPEHNLFLSPTPDFEQLHRELIGAFVGVIRDGDDPQEALDRVAAFWNERM